LKIKYDTIESFSAIEFTCVHPLKSYRPDMPTASHPAAALASAVRIAAASALAGAATLAALAASTMSAASARWTDESIAKAVGYIVHDQSCTLGEIDAAPRAVRDAAWRTWTDRAAASAR